MATVRVRVAAAMFEYSDIGIMACCQATAPAWQLANEMPAELHSMGPHAELTDRMVTETSVTGLHFLGCKSCGTYDREQPTSTSGARLPRGVVKPSLATWYESTVS